MFALYKKKSSLFIVLACLSISFNATAQSGGGAGSLHGTVYDPSGAVVPNATVEIHQLVSGYDRTTTTDANGNFSFPNVPFNPYHMTVTAAGFAPSALDVEVRSAVPASVKVNLQVTGSSTSVTVEAGEDLVENDPTFHTDVDRNLFDKIPLESTTSSLSSEVTLATPGIAADSNGLFHGLGDHAENSFSIDGQPITDQQSKVFSNQLPLDAVQSMEVISGAPPAEYGGKTSVVIVATTRSGLGVTTPHGSVTASYGSFGTSNVEGELAYGGKNWGNFISANGLNTGRFLDPPEFTVMHDKGNEENFFDRVDYQLSTADSLHLNFEFTRSWFQTPNSYDSELATPWNGVIVANGGLGPNGLPVGPADQRSQIKTFNIAPSWTRLLSSATVFTLGGFVRRDAYNYYPSANPFADLGAPALQSETVSQRRTLLNAGLRSDISYVKGIHNLKAGATYEQTFLDEKDPFGIVDPTLNAPCLDANGAPVFVGNPALNNPSQCPTAGTTNPILYPAPFSANPGFDPLLGCYDLTRPTPSPADGCPTSTSGLYTFNGHTDVKELALYVQDSITKGNWALNLGLRGDFYNGLTTHKEAEPRLGVAYNIKRSNTVLRVSYARTMETPFNENLVLSNNGCANPVLGPLLACTVPGITPFTPGWRNEFHAGLQQAFGRYVVFSGEYIWKYTHNAYDFSVLGATPITFPIEWDRSKIPGYAGRVSVPNLHGFSALMVFSSVAARFFTPQLGGAGAVPSAALAGGSVPFRIDHDEKFNLTAHMQYQPWKLGPWLGFNWRYDSGLVAGPAPCAGGNCANGPLGSDTVVDTSGLSPDQQFESGLFCGSVRPTRPSATNPIGTPLSSSLGTNLCPASQYGSTLLQIPAPGTENDDHNPPRIASRSLFDIAVGDDNLFKGERYKWSLTLTAINVANKYALYNFLSTFSGTHYVTPRSVTAQLGFHF
jgi:Carboxypeptidase regulatory-like domain